MSINLKEIKSQHELNDGKRSSDVLLSAIDELEELRKENEAFEKLATNLEKDCELLQKQLEIALKYFSLIKRNVSIASLAYTYVDKAKKEIKELDK